MVCLHADCFSHSLSALAHMHGQQCRHTMTRCCHCFPLQHVHYELNVKICHSFSPEQRPCISPYVSACNDGCPRTNSQPHATIGRLLSSKDKEPRHGIGSTDLIAMPPVLCRFTRLMTGSPTKAQQTKLQGLYMCGGVGVGKTMLMDLLAHSAPSSFQVCAASQPHCHLQTSAPCSSGLPPWEAPVMIAEKRKLFISFLLHVENTS